jgi:ABC-2 type transport system permease protein
LLELVKVNVLSYFDLHKLINAKTKKDFTVALVRTLFLVFLLSLVSYSIYLIIASNVEEYKNANILYIILAEYMAINSSFLIGSNIQKIDDILFKFKDYDLLISLPLKKNKVLNSKLLTVYIFNMIYTIVFMISPYIIYVTNENVDIMFHILFFITLFIIPVVPIIIATILGIFFSYLNTFYKENQMLNLTLTLLMFLLILFLTFKVFNFNNKAGEAVKLVNAFNIIYPLTGVYISILKDRSILALLIFIIVPIILFKIYTFIINKYHSHLYNKINYKKLYGGFEFGDFKPRSQLMAFYKKELKLFLSSNLYVMNTMVGSILLTILVFIYCFIGARYLNIEIRGNVLVNVMTDNQAVLIGAFLLLNCSTAASISLEGNYINILKSLPIKPYKIILAKIMVNLTILMPTILINSSLMLYFSKCNAYFVYYTPCVYALFISMLGIILNLKHPRFNFKSEIVVIKQSVAAIETLIIGVFLAVLPFSQEIIMNDLLFSFVYTKFMEFLNLILLLYLIFNSNKLFRKITEK